jgi:REP element-mobilizing transposase RayT
MKYDPQIHHRRSIRLKGYDYSQAGAYFITICCEDKECRFGKIENDEMVLNEFGTIAYNEWNKLAERFLNFELDVFQIMPNHMHGIIVLVGAGFTPAQNNAGFTEDENAGFPVPNTRAGVNPARTGTIGDIIGAYKSLVANECLKIFKSNGAEVNPKGSGLNPKWAGVNPAPTMEKLWQRNYYEHIIRNEQSFQTISNYIVSNPSKWKDDKFYSE